MILAAILISVRLVFYFHDQNSEGYRLVASGNTRYLGIVDPRQESQARKMVQVSDSEISEINNQGQCQATEVYQVKKLPDKSIQLVSRNYLCRPAGCSSPKEKLLADLHLRKIDGKFILGKGEGFPVFDRLYCHHEEVIQRFRSGTIKLNWKVEKLDDGFLMIKNIPFKTVSVFARSGVSQRLPEILQLSFDFDDEALKALKDFVSGH